MVTRLADVVDMTFGHAFKSSEFTTSEDDINLLRGDNVAQGRLRWDGVKRFPAARLDEVQRYMLSLGDVVIAMDRPWIAAGLKYSVVRDRDLPSLLVQRVARLRAKEESMDQGFLAAIIGSKAFTDYVIGIQTGSAVPHISGGQIGNFKFSLPPLSVQRVIASTLQVLDDKLESCERAIDKSSQLVDALSAGTAPGLPLSPLRDIVTALRDSVNPSKLGTEPIDHYSLPAFDSGSIPERTQPTSILSAKLRVPRRSILLSRLNPRFNRTWWVAPDENVQALASTEFMVLTAVDDVDLAAVWMAVRDERFRDELPRRVTGTSGSHQRVRAEDVLSIEVPNFTLASNEIKLATLKILERVEELRREKVSLTALRDALLPELLSGRVRVSIEDLA